MKKKVLVIGELNVDLILNHIQGFPKIGTEIIADDLTLTLGSSSAIFASNLSAQNIEVSFLGLIGKDQFGSLVLETLNKNNVDTTQVIQSDIYKTGVTVVMNYGMDRAMITHPGAMNHLTYEDVAALDLTVYDHVHISSIFLQPLIKESLIPILKLCKNNGLTTSLDPQWDPNDKWDLPLEELLPLLDVFLPNIAEFKAILKVESVEIGISKISELYNIVAVKEGEKGARLFSKNKAPISIPAFLNNDVVDCIGAGDSFDAGFIYGFIQALSLEKSLERGNILGAANTTAAGGTKAFQPFDATKKMIKEKFNFNI